MCIVSSGDSEGVMIGYCDISMLYEKHHGNEESVENRKTNASSQMGNKKVIE